MAPAPPIQMWPVAHEIQNSRNSVSYRCPDIFVSTRFSCLCSLPSQIVDWVAPGSLKSYGCENHSNLVRFRPVGPVRRPCGQRQPPQQLPGRAAGADLLASASSTLPDSDGNSLRLTPAFPAQDQHLGLGAPVTTVSFRAVLICPATERGPRRQSSAVDHVCRRPRAQLGQIRSKFDQTMAYLTFSPTAFTTIVMGCMWHWCSTSSPARPGNDSFSH